MAESSEFHIVSTFSRITEMMREVLEVDYINSKKDQAIDLTEDLFDNFDDVPLCEMALSSLPTILPSQVVLSQSVVVAPNASITEVSEIPGLRFVLDPVLVEAGRGEERHRSEHNDKWALKRANQLRKEMGLDLSIDLGDLPLAELDMLFVTLFTRVVKVDGSVYPSATLMNMANCFNRLIRRASDIRSLSGSEYVVSRDFNINDHPAFAKTRMVLQAAVRKSAQAGANRKRKKVQILTEEHENAILADLDHQIHSSHGCQKRLAFYLLVRMGIRGGSELWNLRRHDLSICQDKEGAEFIKFEERESKNNCYSLQRYNEEQFRNVYHSYEADFLLTLKQYFCHLPELGEDYNANLFLGLITNPVSNVWYNRKHKVSRDRISKWLKTMLEIVGISADPFSNRSGRATLVTRLASRGVPDEVGMLLTQLLIGHHTTSGFLCYNRTQDLKMEAAVRVATNSNLTYESALHDVSKKFVNEQVVDHGEKLKPLIERIIPKKSFPLASPKKTEDSRDEEHVLDAIDSSEKLTKWHRDYDNIDWDKAAKESPFLARALGGQPKSSVSIGSNISGSNFKNCTININIVHPGGKNKENRSP